MVQKESLLILGAGGYGRMVAETAAATGQFHTIRFLDDKASDAQVLGVCDAFARFLPQYACMLPAFGNNALRRQWLHRLEEAGAKLPTLVHPAAYVSPSATLGKGVVVLPHATVQGGVVAADGVIINVNAVADHDCVLGECAHLAPGAIVKAGTEAPALAKVDSGCIVRRPGE